MHLNPADADSKRLIGRRLGEDLGPVWTGAAARRTRGGRFGRHTRGSQSVARVIPGPDDKPMIVVRYKGVEQQFAAEEISSSMVLARTRETAEAYLGTTITSAVVTVPAVQEMAV
eukprot:XP_008671957.1 heat shock cognate 70 kDa protein-like [Zea mays]